MTRLTFIFGFNLQTNYSTTIIVESIKILYNLLTVIIPCYLPNNKTYQVTHDVQQTTVVAGVEVTCLDI
jgi:hypothetical protein